jgi:hypothetical protein
MDRDQCTQIVRQRDQQAEAVRERALLQGVSRFPLAAGLWNFATGPSTVDRYQWPDVTRLEAIRQLRQAVIPYGDGRMVDAEGRIQ